MAEEQKIVLTLGDEEVKEEEKEEEVKELASVPVSDVVGYAKLDDSGLSEEELSFASISAFKTVSVGKATDGTARDILYAYYPKDSADVDGDGDTTEYIRYEYQLHSETIDPAGNWVGVDYWTIRNNRL